MMNILSILLLFFLPGGSLHPVKITNATVTYKKETGSLTIAINFFADDLEGHLKKTYRMRELDLNNPTKTERDIVGDYVSRRLLIKINREQRALVLEDIEMTDDNVVQVTLSIPAMRGTVIEVMEFNDELLLDAFDNQVNLVHVDLTDEARVLRFANGDAYSTMTMKYVCN